MDDKKENVVYYYRRADSNGRMVIPKDLRSAMGWIPDANLKFWMENGCLVVKVVNEE